MATVKPQKSPNTQPKPATPKPTNATTKPIVGTTGAKVKSTITGDNKSLESMGGYFSQIATTADPGPFILVVHGVGGVGKTSWAAQSPDPMYLVDSEELGIFDLMRYKQVDFAVPVLPPSENWEMTMNILDEVQAKGRSSGRKSLVLDSATGFEYQCFKHHCDEAYDGDWSKKGFFNYQQGPKSAAKSLWPDFLRKLMSIRNVAGMNVIMIAHSQVKSFSNPEGPDFDRWIPYLDKETWATTYRVMENVFFMNYYVDVVTDGKPGKKEVQKGKAKGNQRFLYTVWNPSHDAKNRWGLPELFSMGDSPKEGYAEFHKHVRGGD